VKKLTILFLLAMFLGGCALQRGLGVMVEFGADGVSLEVNLATPVKDTEEPAH
jgi:hypothetical protein